MDTTPFDPYLSVHNTKLEIHLEGKSAVMATSDNISKGLTSFVDENGYPFALVFPEDLRFLMNMSTLAKPIRNYLNIFNQTAKAKLIGIRMTRHLVFPSVVKQSGLGK